MFDPVVIGAITAVADRLVLGASLPTAVVAGLSLAGGKLALAVSKKLIEADDVKTGPFSEIAYVHEIAEASKR